MTVYSRAAPAATTANRPPTWILRAPEAGAEVAEAEALEEEADREEDELAEEEDELEVREALLLVEDEPELVEVAVMEPLLADEDAPVAPETLKPVEKLMMLVLELSTISKLYWLKLTSAGTVTEYEVALAGMLAVQ